MHAVIDDAVFQFHKGTIKTSNGGISCTNANRFQFHKGTIKTIQISL